MKKLNFKDIFIPTFALFFICLIVTSLLAGTNTLTKEPIAKQNEKIKQESMLSVCPEAKAFEQVDLGLENGECYKALDENNDVIGYAISTSEKGYGGEILVMTGFADGEINAVNVYDASDETPGLGANTANEDFTQGFKGDCSADFIVSKDYKTGSSEKSVDAVTGATISSRAVVNAVNEAVEIYQSVEGGGSNG